MSPLAILRATGVVGHGATRALDTADGAGRLAWLLAAVPADAGLVFGNVLARLPYVGNGFARQHNSARRWRT